MASEPLVTRKTVFAATSKPARENRRAAPGASTRGVEFASETRPFNGSLLVELDVALATQRLPPLGLDLLDRQLRLRFGLLVVFHGTLLVAQAPQGAGRGMSGKPHTTLARLLSLAIPLVGTHALVGSMEVVDAAMMRNLTGHSFAAGTFAVSLVVTARISCSAMLSVLTPRVAAAQIQARASELGVLFRIGGYGAVLVGMIAEVFLSVFLWAWSPASLPEEAITQITQTALLLGLGLPFTLFLAASRHMLAGLGSSARLLPQMMLAVPLNAVLNLVLSRGFGSFRGRGVAGIALSSVVVEALLAWMAFRELAREDSRRQEPWNSDGSELRESAWMLVRQGAPLMLAAGVEVGVFQLSGVVVSQGGVDHLAAHQALLTVAGYLAAVPLALMTAASVVVAERRAEGLLEFRTVREVVVFAVLVGLALTGAFWVSGRLVLEVFLPRTSQAWILAVRLFPLLCCLLFLDVVQSTLGGALRGLLETRFVGLAGLLCLGGVGGGGLCVISSSGGSIDGVWWTLIVSLLALVLVYALRIRAVLRPSEVR